MAMQFAVLASGSRGNATWIRAGGRGLLVDVGIGPRQIAHRLASVEASWEQVECVLLTHTHGDHVSGTSLRWMARRKIPLFCHEGHRPALRLVPGFEALEKAGGVRTYDESPFLTPWGARVEALELSHDSGPTFGFRIEMKEKRRGRSTSVGYLADTGTWSHRMADTLADVDLLGVEFNHDVDLQRRSGRPPLLIARILGDRGHLSNDQGADLLTAVLERSGAGAVRNVVLLHLSEHCNQPGLALRRAQVALRTLGKRAALHAARQSCAFPNLWIRPGRATIARRSASSSVPF